MFERRIAVMPMLSAIALSMIGAGRPAEDREKGELRVVNEHARRPHKVQGRRRMPMDSQRARQKVGSKVIAKANRPKRNR